MRFIAYAPNFPFSFIDADPKQKLLHQRQLLNKRLGLDVAASMGVATDDLFGDEDLEMKHQPAAEKPQQVSKPVFSDDSIKNFSGKKSLGNCSAEL